MDGWTLRSRRREAGLTAAQVARVTGTSESNITAHERGDKIPGERTLQRVVDAIDMGSASAVFVHRLMTVPEASSAIRFGLRNGWTLREFLRIVREHRSNAKWVSRPEDRKVFFARPATTGDMRWDAMLAGSTEDLALRSAVPPPEWTTMVRLKSSWFVAQNPAFNEYLRMHSSAPFNSRGVMVDPDALESV